MNGEPVVHAPELPADARWLNVGAPLSLRALRGHLVILDFWTYCCVNCMHVLPVLRAIEQRHVHEPLVVIGVHSAKFDAEEDPARVEDAIARYGVRHPVIVDREMAIWRSFAVRSWPTLVVVRPDGTIAATAPGEPDPDVLEAFVCAELERARVRGQLARGPIAMTTPTPVAEGPLAYPGKLDVAPDGRIALADSGHHRVLVLDAEGRVLETIGTGLCGFAEGALETAALDDPQGVRWDATGRALFVADARAHVVARIDLAARTLTRVAGTGQLGELPLEGRKVALATALRSPWDLSIDGERLLVAMAGSHQLAAIDLAAGTIELLAGTGAESILDGAAMESTFAQPSGLALHGRTLFVADSETSAVRAVDLQTMQVRTLVGRGLFEFGDVDGAADVARLQHCLGVARGPDGALVVADTYNDKLRRVDPLTGAVSTLFVEADGITLREPSAATWDARRGAWLVVDTGHARLVEVSADGSRARAIAVRGAPSPATGESAPRAARRPAQATDWYTSDVSGDGALSAGAGEVVLRVLPCSGSHLAGRSSVRVAIEVSRRSDLVVPRSTKLRHELPQEVAEFAIRIPIDVAALPADAIDAEITACIDVVLCSEGGSDAPAACTPTRCYVRLPLRLERAGAQVVRFEVPVRDGPAV